MSHNARAIAGRGLPPKCRSWAGNSRERGRPLDPAEVRVARYLSTCRSPVQREEPLWAYLDSDGSLHIDGQDLGPDTAPVSDDGEYEWFTTVRATHVCHLVELLGGDQDSDVLDLLAKRYSGMGSYELERVIRESEPSSPLALAQGAALITR